MQFIVQQCTRASTVAARAGMTRDERVIEHIREHPGATQKQIRAAVGCSEERMHDSVKRLLEEGAIDMQMEKFYGRMVKRYYPVNAELRGASQLAGEASRSNAELGKEE